MRQIRCQQVGYMYQIENVELAKNVINQKPRCGYEEEAEASMHYFDCTSVSPRNAQPSVD